MTKLTILSADDKLAEVRRLYFATTKRTIAEDFARAVQLLKSMNTEDERERATVYMDGLAQMRSDWAKEKAGRPGRPPRPGTAGKSAGAAGKPAGPATAAKVGRQRKVKPSKG